jgi:hypothetical protein
MENIKNSTVDINAMIDAFEMDQYFEYSFIDPNTGEVTHLTDDDEDEDEGIPEHYIALPDSAEVNKFGIMEDFCSLVENKKIQQNLENCLGGKGSFGRFMATLHAHEIQGDWYHYLHERLKEFSIQFCKDNGLEYHYTIPLRFR